MKRSTFVAAAGMPHVLAVIVLLIAGCPPPANSPQTVLAADGATITVTPETACANLNVQCGTNPTSCVADIAALTGGSPLDLACMTSAGSKSAAKACVGVGALCP